MTKLKQLQEDTRFRVLALLEKSPDISQRDLAKALGISLGGVNYSLRALVEKGMVKAQNFSSSDNKLAYAYILTPRGLAEKSKLTANFLKRKVAEYEALKVEIESLQNTVHDQRQSALTSDNEYYQAQGQGAPK
jgi:EPS-associated MarR family transcriptional regulator